MCRRGASREERTQLMQAVVRGFIRGRSAARGVNQGSTGALCAGGSDGVDPGQSWRVLSRTSTEVGYKIEQVAGEENRQQMRDWVAIMTQ